MLTKLSVNYSLNCYQTLIINVLATYYYWFWIKNDINIKNDKLIKYKSILFIDYDNKPFKYNHTILKKKYNQVMQEKKYKNVCGFYKYKKSQVIKKLKKRE